jgi:hypothetical protein
MKLQEWNTMQIVEALGEVSRYFFWKHHNREPFDDDELVLYYVDYGGAECYRAKHQPERKPEDEQESKEN